MSYMTLCCSHPLIYAPFIFNCLVGGRAFGTLWAYDIISLPNTVYKPIVILRVFLGAEFFLRGYPPCFQLVKTFLDFMEPESSLPRVQVPAAYRYPEPVLSGQCPPSFFLKILLNIIPTSTPGYSKWSLSLTFLHHNTVRNSSP